MCSVARRGLVAAALLVLGVVPTSAQDVTQLSADVYQVTYRPSTASYRVVHGTYFDVIYQVGTEETAVRVRRALNASRAGTDSLVGNTPGRFHMPVVVDGFSDRSNGFVTPFPFKQEIEAPSLRSDALVARSSSWPALVGPHELVHAMHADMDVGFGFGDIVRWFAPDAARATNLTAPRGLVEGIAVYRESQFEPGAGRLNAPLFHMKMRAAMLSDDPWSLTQMMEPPRYTQPYDRFYIGGAHAFAEWATAGDTTSTTFFREATALHNQVPFLGFGVGLWHGLGASPGALEDSLRTRFRDRYAAELDRLRPFTDRTVIAGQTGRNYRRPYWIGDDTLVAYLEGYDVRAGFYRIDAETGTRTRIRTQAITEDHAYTVAPDTSALYASRYVPDPWVPTQDVAEVERVDLSTGTLSRLTDGGRAFAPAQTASGTVWAVRNDGAFTQWAVVESGSTRVVTDLDRTRFKHVVPAPSGTEAAVVVNVDGQQRVYRATETADGTPQLTPWFGLQDALIYDVSWGPSGRYLLFASDLTGIANVFAFDTETQAVVQCTNVPFGALEPTLSPDAATLAFVEYQHERHELVRTPFRPGEGRRVDAEHVLVGPDSALPLPRSTTADSEWTVDTTRPYRAWNYMAPRMAYPTLHYDTDEADTPNGDRFERLGVGVGVGVAGNDPLQRWLYRGEAYWQNGRLWGDATIRSARWRLRPSLTVFNTPETLAAVLPTDSGPQPARVGFEERGVSLGARLPVTFQSNVVQSSAIASLTGQFRQTRLFGTAVDPLERQNGAALTDWTDRLTLFPQAAWGYRLQQNPRDVVPNQGLVVRSYVEVDAWTDGVTASRAWVTEADVYLPLSLRRHTGLRLGAGVVTQNAGSVVALDAFLPRGYENIALGPGTFGRLGAEITQPLWYVDDGWTLVPVYAKGLYAYGFGQTLAPVDALSNTLSSVGAGLGLQMRLFYLLDLTLEVGIAYRLEPGDVEVVTR